jgi:uncharacterized protein (TIRG00374 family)
MSGDTWRRLRVPILLIVLLVAVWALAPQALDLPKLVARFRTARPLPVLIVAVLQACRYLGAGLLMCLFARALGFGASPLAASEVALASGAAAKLIPVAGAGGIAVRFAYLKRCGVGEAAIGGYFLLQNVLGTAVLVTLFAASVVGSGRAGPHQVQYVAPALLTLVAFATLIVWLRRRPGDARRAGRALGRAGDALARRLGKQWHLEQRFDAGGDSLCQALTLGNTSPWRLAEATFYASWTIVGDIASLYVAGLALGLNAGVGATVVAYSIASFAATAVAMPAGLGVTEGAMAAVLAGYGMPLDAAVSQVLLYRALSFWLPIVLGLLSAWRLRRKGTF